MMDALTAVWAVRSDSHAGFVCPGKTAAGGSCLRLPQRACWGRLPASCKARGLSAWLKTIWAIVAFRSWLAGIRAEGCGKSLPVEMFGARRPTSVWSVQGFAGLVAGPLWIGVSSALPQSDQPRWYWRV